MKNTKLQNPSLRKRKGFTLIELIVVIAILAILAAIAIPTFLNQLKNARLKADYASARVIASSFAVAIASDEVVTDVDSVQKLENEGYLEEVPEVQSEDGDFFLSITTDTTTGDVTDVEVTLDDADGTVFYPMPPAAS